MLGVAVGGPLAELLHERLEHVRGERVDAVVVVAEGREVAVGLEVDDQPALVADGADPGVLDGREAVGHDGEAGHAEGHRPLRVVVVERHLDALVRVLVVHVVDDVHRADVDVGEPVHHLVEAGLDLVVVEHVALDGRQLRPHLVARDLVTAAVEGVEEALREVDAGAEELHLLAHLHGRDAARDRRVVAVGGAHEGVALVLDRARLDRELGAEALEAVGEGRVPEDREVRLGRRAEVAERLEEAEARLRHERPAVEADAADDLGDPRRVAGEERVVLLRPQEAHDAELDHEVVDDLLGLLLGERAVGEVALEVDVEEGGGAAERHRGAVLLLDGGEVAEVEPLHGLLRRRRRAGDVVPVIPGHLLQLVEGAELLGELLAVADDGIGDGRVVEAALLGLLGFDESVDAVERHTAVVADNAAAAVGVREPGDDAGAAGLEDLGRVGVEDAVVVGLPVLREGLLHDGVDLEAVGLEPGLDHAEAAVREDRALERRVRLQPDDQLVLAVDVAGIMREDAAGHLRHVEHAALALHFEELAEAGPEVLGALGRPGEEGRVPSVGRVVALDEVADVDPAGPRARGEAAPRRRLVGAEGGVVRQGGHSSGSLR